MQICCGWRTLLLSCSLHPLSDSNSSTLLLGLDASRIQDQTQRVQNYVFFLFHQFLCVWQRQLARSVTQMVSELSCSKYCALRRQTGMKRYHSHVSVMRHWHGPSSYVTYGLAPACLQLPKPNQAALTKQATSNSVQLQTLIGNS